MRFFKFLILVACVLNVFSDELVQINVMEESEIDSSLSENIVVYGIISELASSNTNISVACATDLTNILRSINKQDMWAIKVMDASGTYHGSFVWGQNAWLGSKQSCDFLNKAPKYTISPDVPKLMDKHLISTISQMEMDFKMIFMVIVSPYKVDPLFHLKTANYHRLGVCLPKSCSNGEIELLSQSFFSRQKLKFQKNFNATMDVTIVRNMDNENFLNRPEVSRIFIAICIATASVILFSIANKFVENTNMDGLKRFFKCFSIYDNVASIYNTTTSPNNINCINGIRTIICLWVLLIHCGYYSMYAYDNLPAVMAALERIEIQPIFAIVFYVDMFFVLSALLLTYNFLKDERTLSEVRNNTFIGNVKLFIKKVVHRYVRLTPAFIFTIGIGHLFAIYLQESSSYFIDVNFDTYCTPNSFIKSLFYTHNLFEVRDLCLSWSWYLGCDMQFYIIVLFILFVYASHPAIAKTIFVALLAAMTAGGIYLNVEINLLPRIDSIFHHLDEFYLEPWNRMHPYLAGCTVGYIMFQIKDKKFPKSPFITIPYWTVTFAVTVGTLFLTYFKESTNLHFALALSFGRYFLGLFVGSMVVMCQLGYGGVFNNVFSSRFFVHLNKTTYVMYLIHPMLIMIFNGNQETSPHFDVPSITPLIAGIMVLSYIAAIILTPIIEIPYQKLSDEYVMKKSKTKK